MSWCLLVGVPILRLTLAVKASVVSLSALLEGWQNLDRSPRLLFGKPQFVKTLQIQPKLGARAKEMTKAQGCVTSNGALSIQNPGDAIGWHLQLAREFGGAKIKSFQFLG